MATIATARPKAICSARWVRSSTRASWRTSPAASTGAVSTTGTGSWRSGARYLHVREQRGAAARSRDAALFATRVPGVHKGSRCATRDLQNLWTRPIRNDLGFHNARSGRCDHVRVRRGGGQSPKRGAVRQEDEPHRVPEVVAAQDDTSVRRHHLQAADDPADEGGTR